ncbi:MAG: RidA family protein [Planctomycetes bacterium]|nr:RidA family protein [Planctomycetota bacterium]
MVDKLVNPNSLPFPSGYNNGVIANGFLFVAGQTGRAKDGKLVSNDFVEQFERALWSVLEVARESGSKPENIVRFTMYVTDKKEYLSNLKELGAVYRKHMGKHYPAMALVEVKALIQDGAKIEIEATASIES